MFNEEDWRLKGDSTLKAVSSNLSNKIGSEFGFKLDLKSERFSLMEEEEEEEGIETTNGKLDGRKEKEEERGET